MADLCHSNTTANEAAFAISSVTIGPPPGLESERCANDTYFRQEVLEGLRVLAEEIMQSLRILLTTLFSMTGAIHPEEEVGEAEMHPINQLIQEVKNQKNNIAELGNLISQQFLRGATSPTNSAGQKSDAWEIFEMEELNGPEEVSNRTSQAAPVHATSPPRALTSINPQPSPQRPQVPQVASLPTRPRACQPAVPTITATRCP